jgi:hypothetical protein
LCSTHLLCVRLDLLRTANGRAVPSHQFPGLPAPLEGSRSVPSTGSHGGLQALPNHNLMHATVRVPALREKIGYEASGETATRHLRGWARSSRIRRAFVTAFFKSNDVLGLASMGSNRLNSAGISWETLSTMERTLALPP